MWYVVAFGLGYLCCAYKKEIAAGAVKVFGYIKKKVRR